MSILYIFETCFTRIIIIIIYQLYDLKKYLFKMDDLLILSKLKDRIILGLKKN